MDVHPLMLELDKLREGRYWSVHRWAKESRLSYGTLSGNLQGRNHPSLTTLEAAAKPFGRVVVLISTEEAQILGRV